MMVASREKRLIEDLQADLRLLSNETKRKYPPVKEAAESAIMIIRTVIPSTSKVLSADDIVPLLRDSCRDVLQPFIMGCDTRSLNVVQLCLTAIQRLVTHEIADAVAAKNIVCILWQVYEQGAEELQLRLLQTVIVLVTSRSSALTGQSLARAIVLCFRLHFTKSDVINNTAEASIRQVVSLVFDRVVEEDKKLCACEWKGEDYTPRLGDAKFAPPPSLSQASEDAYCLFQDLGQLVNADSPHWLVGITEMTRTFGLELLESVLLEYESVFKNHAEFKFLLKDRVCALVIRLFSPNIQHRQGAPPPPAGLSPSLSKDKPFFPISMRLLRLVSILLKKYYTSLITESEIFLSLLIKFLETDKPSWQRVLAVEVLSQLCAQPELLKSFCISYDMQAHSTKIFKNMVSSLCKFIQNIFLSPSQSSAAIAESNGNSATPVAHAQFSFEHHGINFPLPPLMSPASNCIRYIYLEMLDKNEPPLAPEGYLLAVAYVSLLDLVRALTMMFGSELAEEVSDVQLNKGHNNNKLVLKEMINSSWQMILSVLSLLLGACRDEACNESILKCMESLAGICGQLELDEPRDAFIITLCKASLPAHYPVPILQMAMPSLSAKVNLDYLANISNDEQNVVAMRQSLHSGNNALPSALTSVSLTSKNLQCMRAILNLSNCYGSCINTAWQYLLTTLQHLVWILGLQPSAGGQLRPSPRSSDSASPTNNSVLTTAVLSDLPVLSSMLTRLFETSKDLDDVALHHLINALCSLSVEAMDMAYDTAVKEPSLFAVAKLMETGLVNMDRIEILWRPVTGHLLEVCQHPNSTLREWGAEGVTSLVKTALKQYCGEKLKENPRLLNMFLIPFKEISSIDHFDVRYKQLDSVLQILHNCGDSLCEGWPAVLDIIGSGTKTDSESLVRLGFKSVQLVISDYLVSLQISALPCCIDVVEQYATQTQDFNISLTSIGLLWSMSDYINQNQDKMLTPLLTTCVASNKDDSENTVLQGTDQLWMYLFGKMGKLCTDRRPAVRKSAGQALFSTLSAHWSNISTDTWHEVIWKVLFPLMDEVQKTCNNAPTDRNTSSGGNILMHHSRDTEEKQWQETSVLTLAGISRVFKTKQSVLSKMDDFHLAWDKVLDYIQTAATSNSVEVSRSALCSFEEILNPVENPLSESILWRKSWRAWCNIGIKITIPPPPGQTAPDEMLSQAYLTSLVLLFPCLHSRIIDSFDAIDFMHLAQVLHGTVCIPVRSDATAFILPTGNCDLTPLQQAVVNAVDIVQKSVSSHSDGSIYPAVFKFLLSIVDFASFLPSYGDIKNHTGPPDKSKWVCVNYVAFAEHCMQAVVNLFQITACHKAVIQQGILVLIVKTFRGAIKRKYNCQNTETWQLAVSALIKILQAGLPIVRQHSQPSPFNSLWDELGGCMGDVLFPASSPPSTLTVEEHKKLESFDVRLVELIRSEVLPYRSAFPTSFLDHVVSLLNKGSIHSSLKEIDNQMVSERSRDELSQQCFSTLFQFSMKPLTNGNGGDTDGSLLSEVNETTVTSLLQRCRTALTQYVSSDRLKTRFPLSEAQLTEVMFSLKALNKLLPSLVRNKPIVTPMIWRTIFDLFPVLVECIPASSQEVRISVAQVIGQFQQFLSVDTSST